MVRSALGLLLPSLCACTTLLGFDQEAVLECAPTEERTPPSALLNSCVLRASCSPLLLEGIGACIEESWPAASPYDRCTMAASTCDDIDRCFGYGWASPQACPEGAAGWRCDQDIATRCGIADPYFVDCAAHGASCRLYTGSESDGRWPCAFLQAPACTAPPQESFCDRGGRRFSCIDGLRYGVNCSALGRRCLFSASIPAFCSSLIESCDFSEELLEERCDGDVDRLCLSLGIRLSADCGAAGGACGARGCESASGCRSREPCAPRCLSSTELQVCVHTLPVRISCEEHGFARCEELTVNGEPHARCRE